MKLKLALLQMDISFGNPAENFTKAQQMIKNASKQQPDVIVLPELWTTGYDLTRLDQIADHKGEKTKRVFSELAKQYNVNIVAGSIANQTNEGTLNTTFAFNRKGEIIGEYSKVHLFRLMDEEKYLIAGDDKGSFTIEGIPAASVICYDIRFPEWIRRHVLDGAKLMFVTAEWPKARVDHWRTLLVSRAIENQTYVIACNRVGSDPNNQFAGHSMIIDPWGEIISEGNENEMIVYGEISSDDVTSIRNRIPVFEDRRPQLY
ncbi:carbon-nitrogen family hydrolase [Desertibacillus haloalkaliphilus]|uniref:carbon-nitrogen family hydrolase n=1 Tax=Desertibacillus haloalkaliphilus TaxID=1328930 RepID=UPI001C27AD87|nr:carbon-nitrogen family hydrolase [Desertibacillus haloalkaliphilus]MBU8904971.1 carbon-nitrogen family hydrolase [Desertibacillus haloalkaliphilus]